MNRNTKRNFINATYEILISDGIEGFTIRKVARAVGCTSAVLYKHFNNADHLLALASIRFLSRYAEDTKFLAQLDFNPLELNLQLWECFAYYAFENIPIFENLFFGNSIETFQETVLEYYQEFTEEISDLKDYLVILMRSNNIIERDFIMLKRAADAGMITLKSADYLSKVDVYIFRGMLSTYRDKYGNTEVTRMATKEYMDIIRKMYKMHTIK